MSVYSDFACAGFFFISVLSGDITELLLFISVLEGLCTTKVCVTVASSMLNSMDESVSPCSDFYQYACGGWMKAHPIPSGESRWDTFGVLRRANQIVLKNVLG